MAVSAVDALNSIPSTSSSSSSAAGSGTTDALQSMTTDDFMQLMITELQNQDPLNPMDNSELLQEISQMREISATSDMTTTLQSVLMEQNISSASSLIGKQVQALDDSGNTVSGTVDAASIAGGDVTLQIGDSTVQLSNVSQILPSASPFLSL